MVTDKDSYSKRMDAMLKFTRKILTKNHVAMVNEHHGNSMYYLVYMRINLEAKRLGLDVEFP
jgi:hypothetical protein